MIYLIFIGDMLVMAFMIILVMWLFLRNDVTTIEEAARIPLDDEEHQGG
ncbi:MAG: hypothetical protein AAF384_11800 [Pseudomonadota bacterium]